VTVSPFSVLVAPASALTPESAPAAAWHRQNGAIADNLTPRADRPKTGIAAAARAKRDGVVAPQVDGGPVRGFGSDVATRAIQIDGEARRVDPAGRSG